MDSEPIYNLRFKPDKTVQAIDYIAFLWPNVSHYYVCKVLYFADKMHCLDWGRTITGDRYVAMPHGPVPSETYDLLKHAESIPSAAAQDLRRRLNLIRDNGKLFISTKGSSGYPALSPSDQEALVAAVALCRGKTFGELADIAHKELAWTEAVERGQDSNAPAMNLAMWFDEETREAAGEHLREHARYGVT